MLTLRRHKIQTQNSDTAAKLFRSDIKCDFESEEVYPGSRDIRSVAENLNLVPDSLQLFLKIAAIGKASMQAA